MQNKKAFSVLCYTVAHKRETVYRHVVALGSYLVTMTRVRSQQLAKVSQICQEWENHLYKSKVRIYNFLLFLRTVLCTFKFALRLSSAGLIFALLLSSAGMILMLQTNL